MILKAQYSLKVLLNASLTNWLSA